MNKRERKSASMKHHINTEERKSKKGGMLIAIHCGMNSSFDRGPVGTENY